MKILVASDHAGFGLKTKVLALLKELGHEAVDMGPFEYDAEDDYPDFIAPVAKEVSNDPENTKAIILGASGQGEAIVANRYPNVRAVVYYGEPDHLEPGDISVIELAREHNNSNVLSLGARFLSEEDMKKAVQKWLETQYNGEIRHERRIDKIDGNR